MFSEIWLFSHFNIHHTQKALLPSCLFLDVIYPLYFPCPSVITMSFLLQVITDTLTVVEGGETGIIEVITSLPPEYFCENRTMEDGPEVCKISIWGYIDITPDDLKCYESGEFISQAVFGYDAAYPVEYGHTCGLYINSENWLETLRIPVTAMIDGVVDGDQSRFIHVHHQVEYNMIEMIDQNNTKIKTIDVSNTKQSG